MPGTATSDDATPWWRYTADIAPRLTSTREQARGRAGRPRPRRTEPPVALLSGTGGLNGVSGWLGRCLWIFLCGQLQGSHQRLLEVLLLKRKRPVDDLL